MAPQFPQPPPSDIMLDLPVLVHLSRLVSGLADRSDAEHDAGDDEDQITSDESHETQEKVT